MEKFREIIAYMKNVRESTPEGEPSCPVVNLKNGYMDVFKLSQALTANIYLKVSGKEFLFQIEDRRNERVAVYPPDGSGRSTIASYYDYDDNISFLMNLKTNRELANILVENIKAMND